MRNNKQIYIIAAVSINGVIGNNNKIPWDIKEDMKIFRQLTTGNYVIMGRKTYESIGKPLKERINVVITKNKYYSDDGCIFVNSLEEAINACTDKKRKIYIIGGSSVFNQAINIADVLILSEIQRLYDGDSYFPQYSTYDWIEKTRIVYPENKETNRPEFHFVGYVRRK